METSSFVVISTDVLPEIFPKVLEVKRLLACGEEKSSASACKRVGISRSAFYKYRECVFAYEEKLTQKIISYYALLKDEPGVLSSILSEFHRQGANIITVNQNMPIDGVAAVNITVRLFGDAADAYGLKNDIAALAGVVDVKFISGE
ncbi:MAG: ACT domain-containing protein [Ruminococcus sp.]|nr:ACT domain-containing protein [Ruminococcus sp.]MCM1381622.1 ACT domain-containing protein [Muribaculaceae bacterium]MCM1479498.1 ACT domain-containing protein [Muribaculaceae bacterium]